jgi:molybdopterin-synthase adenylyltransferase
MPDKLSREEQNKYIRQIILPGIGVDGQLKIRNAKVLMIGCGGLGCPALLYLAASGVGTIGLADHDTVTITNLHRQVLYGNADKGRKKTEVAIEKISAMHPEVNLVMHDVKVDESNAAQLINAYDIVIDGCDNFKTRYIINDACAKSSKPLVYGSILGFQGQLCVFNYRNGKNLRDLFPEPPADGEVPDCSENGVMPSVPGIIGTMMANECLKVILGNAEPSGWFFILDAATLETERLSF